MLEEAITSNQSLTPDLISKAQEAFTAFLHNKLIKSLPSPVEPSSPNDDSISHFQAILAKDNSDSAWAKAAREKEEKFSMYLTSLSKSGDAIRQAEALLAKGQSSAEDVKSLVEGASDVLGPYLGEKVSRDDTF